MCRFLLLWSEGYHDSAVGDVVLTIFWYLGFVNEKHGVSARYVPYALGETSKFVSITFSPNVFLGIQFDEVSIL